MLTAKENQALTEVGPGTPMGEFMRRYWIPAAKSEEVQTPGGAPARVTLLGEKLVVFRSRDGQLGLIDEFCPHRRASLAYARNEPEGLRCLYHGWKVACDGRVLESPPEPPARTFAKKLSVTSYPVREAGGLIWTYMGPRELEPPFPKFPWLDLPSDRLLVVKMYQATNYLQGVEGDLDPAHPNYLHRDFDLDDTKSWAAAGWQSIADIMSDGSPEIECEKTPYLMRHAAIRKSFDPKNKYVRVFEWVAPFYCYIATGPHESQLFKAWHPIDDHNCFTFYIHFDPDRPLDTEAIYENWRHRTSPPDYKTVHTAANMHLQDRELMDRGNFSGVTGAAVQDRAMQEGMDPICDRTKEHLGTSDKAVIFYRRLLLERLEDMAAGKPLPAHDPSLTFQQRGYSSEMPADQPWTDVARWQDERARRKPPVAAE
jgi:phenylpropionate dioxygenase-like ring-hydroxylating dioxygenase large terminal subunit